MDTEVKRPEVNLGKEIQFHFEFSQTEAVKNEKLYIFIVQEILNNDDFIKFIMMNCGMYDDLIELVMSEDTDKFVERFDAILEKVASRGNKVLDLLNDVWSVYRESRDKNRLLKALINVFIEEKRSELLEKYNVEG